MIDGYPTGAPIDAAREWVSAGEGAGAWIQLDFPAPVTLTGVALSDRPGTADGITAATVLFSDGSSVRTGALPDGGALHVLPFAARTVTSVRLRVDAVTATTTSVGLTEFAAYGSLAAGAGTAVRVDAGDDQTVKEGTLVTLHGSALVADGSTPSYAWTQTAGPTVALSSASAAAPTFTAPAAGATVTFALVASPEFASSATATVTVTSVADVPANLARAAGVTLTASSESTGQGADKAADGVITSADYVHEWATNGGKAGSWWQAAFADPVIVDHVVLSDRTNAYDRVAGGQLVFSDGSVVDVAALPDDGTPVTIAFPARATKTVRFVVTGVSATTLNAGLSEIEIWGIRAPGNTAPFASAGSAKTVAAVVLCDRPATTDRITSAQLVFSDGSVVNVGTLPNDGSPLTVSFTARTTTSVRLVVTGVSTATTNVGLAEIQIMGIPAS